MTTPCPRHGEDSASAATAATAPPETPVARRALDASAAVYRAGSKAVAVVAGHAVHLAAAEMITRPRGLASGRQPYTRRPGDVLCRPGLSSATAAPPGSRVCRACQDIAQLKGITVLTAGHELDDAQDS